MPNNIANCALKAFNIYKKLWKKDSSQKDLLENFSEDTLLVYLNSFKKFNLQIASPTKKHPFYTLKSKLNLANITKQDIKVLAATKKNLANNFDYQELIKFNNFLIELTNYVNNEIKNDLIEIANKKPIKFQQTKLILELERYILQKQASKILYKSGKKEQNYNILPVFLNLENASLYLWAKDSSLEELRCFKADKIIALEKSDEIFNNTEKNNFVIVELYKTNGEIFPKSPSLQILKETKRKIHAKIFYKNNFELTQKILHYGTNCKVIEPLETKILLKKTLEAIKGVYEK